MPTEALAEATTPDEQQTEAQQKVSHIQEIHLLMDGTELEKFGLVSTSMIAERPVN